MAKYRLNHETVVSGAVELVNQRGADALSLAEVAAKFRVRTPSLYNHIDGLDGLRRDLALRGLIDLANRIRPAIAGLAAGEALGAMATEYRRFARENPGLYPFTLRAVKPDDGELKAAEDEVLDLVAAALRGYRLEGDEARHAVRTARSLIHGFVALEQAGAFAAPPDLDTSYARLVELVDGGLRRWRKS